MATNSPFVCGYKMEAGLPTTRNGTAPSPVVTQVNLSRNWNNYIPSGNQWLTMVYGFIYIYIYISYYIYSIL